MNWYPRYAGDYMQDTAHLSLAEHGAYTMLLDHYYGSEKPLPDDEVSLFRICRAFTPEEQAAVSSIASAYFPVNGDGLRHNKRADRELAKRQTISHKRRMAGAIGADSKWHGKEMANATTPTSTSTITTKPTNTEGERAGAQPKTPKPKSFKQWTLEEFRQVIADSNQDQLLTDEQCDEFFGYWTEPSAAGIPRYRQQTNWDTRRRMQNAKRMIFDNAKSKPGGGARPINHLPTASDDEAKKYDDFFRRQQERALKS